MSFTDLEKMGNTAPTGSVSRWGVLRDELAIAIFVSV
jgi:hypothetical protein